jgi:hypothetical protein
MFTPSQDEYWKIKWIKDENIIESFVHFKEFKDSRRSIYLIVSLHTYPSNHTALQHLDNSLPQNNKGSTTNAKNCCLIFSAAQSLLMLKSKQSRPLLCNILVGFFDQNTLFYSVNFFFSLSLSLDQPLL